MERINELLRDEIADLIRKELQDPRLAGILSLTDVETAPDLSTAKVYVSVMGSGEDKKASLAALRHAAGFFRHELTQRLRLRRVPELDFRLDVSIERGDHVLSIIRQLEQEQQEEPNEPQNEEAPEDDEEPEEE
ncbi:MAG: 30S ribosome-binding factor RbfA [Dehalococcoidales bacterium]|nr:30S ribosome-binding factor RbfA [Dehalococcoidales bacterium]